MTPDEKEAYCARATLSPFRRKVEQALELIGETYIPDQSYVALSWGKDSSVLYHLCQQIERDIPAVFYSSCEIDLVGDYDEVTKLYHSRFGGKVITIVPEPDWWNTPDSTQDRIHAVLQGDASNYAYVGLRAQESINRRRVLRKYGLVHTYQSGNHQGKTRICPLAWWKTEDIWTYLAVNNIPFLNTYYYSDRTNPNARYWFWAHGEDFMGVSALAHVKRHNPELYQLLKENNNGDR